MVSSKFLIARADDMKKNNDADAVKMKGGLRPVAREKR
jgi:hypothetical protein